MFNYRLTLISTVWVYDEKGKSKKENAKQDFSFDDALAMAGFIRELAEHSEGELELNIRKEEVKDNG